MKWIIAIIQPHRLEAVKQSLTEVEVFRLTVSDVQGYGRQKGHTEYFRGQPMQVNLIRKVRLDIAVNDEFVQPTMNAVIRGARSGRRRKGQVGDGKTVYPAAGKYDPHQRWGSGRGGDLKGSQKSEVRKTLGCGRLTSLAAGRCISFCRRRRAAIIGKREGFMVQAGSTMNVAVIDVRGMTCQHCVKQVQQALAGTPGVTRASVDLARNEAHVTFDSGVVSIARLMETVNQTGYTANGFTRGPAGEHD